MKQKPKTIFEFILLDSILKVGYSEDISVSSIRELANEVIAEFFLNIDLDETYQKRKHEKVVKKILLNIYNKLDKIPEDSIWYDNGIKWSQNNHLIYQKEFKESKSF